MALLPLPQSAAWAQSSPLGTFQGLGFIAGGYPGYAVAALSANGSVVAGDNYQPCFHFCFLARREAFVWSAATGMQGLGFINGGGPKPYSYATGLSADGSVVVGSSTYSNTPISTFLPELQAFRWTQAGGMEGLGFINGGGRPPFGRGSSATGLSADGSVVVGNSTFDNTGQQQAFRWTAATGMQGLGFINGGGSASFGRFSWATGLSADGSVVVGNSSFGNTGQQQAFRWTAATGMQGLGFINGGGRPLVGRSSFANGLSADGSVVVGNSSFDNTGELQAFRWTQRTGMQGLGFINGGGRPPFGRGSSATGLSADGSVVVGNSTFDNTDQQQAFRWTATTGMQGLGFINGGGRSPFGRYSFATGLSADGSVVVGNSTFDNTGQTQAFRWTQRTGMRSLSSLLTAAGVNLASWSLFPPPSPFAGPGPFVSANGEFIAGIGTDPSGRSQAYIARYIDGAGSAIGGLTTPGSVRFSVDALGAERRLVMAQEHGFAAPLLGDNSKIGARDSLDGFATGGATAAGVAGHKRLGEGLDVFLGGAVTNGSYGPVSMSDASLFAGSLRYVHDFGVNVRPFAQLGIWYSPTGTYQFTRNYMNGAGVATGVGTTGGRQGYVFGRLGTAFDITPDDEVALSGEFGRQAFRTGAYIEPLSIANPFEAQVATGTDVMNVAKARAQLTHAFSAHIDATLWGALAQAYDYRSTVTASIPAMGEFAPVRQLASWSEYGLRLSYHMDDLVTIDAFADGVTGDRASQTLFDANTGLSVAGLTTRIHIGGGARIRF